MTISGVTQSAQLYPMNQNATQVERPYGYPESEAEAIQGVESANVQMEVSVQVQDMALQQMEEAASQLLQDVAAQTGIGQYVNMLA